MKDGDVSDLSRVLSRREAHDLFKSKKCSVFFARLAGVGAGAPRATYSLQTPNLKKNVLNCTFTEHVRVSVDNAKVCGCNNHNSLIYSGNLDD